MYINFLKNEKIHLIWFLYAIVGVFGGMIKDIDLGVNTNSILFCSLTVLLSSIYGLVISGIKNSKSRNALAETKGGFILGAFIIFIILYLSTGMCFSITITIIIAILIICYSFFLYILQYIDEDYISSINKDIDKNIKNFKNNNTATINNKEIEL